MKNKKLKSYVVSSADWDIEVDANDPKSAALSGLMYQFHKFRTNLLVSTTIMVNEKNYFINKNIMESDFFATHKIFKEIGMDVIASNFLEFTELQNEIKSS